MPQEQFTAEEGRPILPADLKNRLVLFVDETYPKTIKECEILRNKYSTAIEENDILGLLELSERVQNSVWYRGEKLERKERDALYALDADLKKWLDDSTTI